MDGTFLASLSVLFALFAVIAAFIGKLWWDERDGKRRAEALLAMGLGEKNPTDGGERANRRQRFAANTPEPGEEDSDEDVDEEATAAQFGDKKIGKKKLAKLQAKAEAKAQREQEQTERQERKRQEELRAKKEEEDKRLEELKELKEKEALRAEQEEKRRREQEEYDKLKESFAVEDQGYDHVEEEESGNLMRVFIDYVIRMKVVYVDELASHFRLSSEDVVKRLEMMVDDKLLTGVFDDRGKFIYISQEELLSVARFINQRGRVSVRELADYSNKLISLEPTKSE